MKHPPKEPTSSGANGEERSILAYSNRPEPDPAEDPGLGREKDDCMIRAQCTACSARFELDALPGPRATCPRCGGALSTDGQSPPPEPAVAEPDPVPAPAQAPERRPVPPPPRQDEEPVHKTDVSYALTAALGALLAVGFYALVFLGLPGTYIGEIFTNRGWVPYVIVFLTSWSAAILVLKTLRLRAERAAFDIELLELNGNDIRPEDAPGLRERVERVEQRIGTSFLTRRVAGLLNHFASRRSGREAAAYSASQSDIDETNVDSSYTMLKVFIWAVPILGFTGTVIGIGDAVASFSTKVAETPSLDQVKNSLGGVTSGLGVAFDTTLLALVVSILLMFPTNWLQKSEEDVIGSVTGYCNERILIRLDDADSRRVAVAAPGPLPMDAAAERIAGSLEAWIQRLQTIGSDVSGQVAEAWQRIDERLQTRHEQHARQVAEAFAEAVAARKTGEDDRIERLLREASAERRVFVEELRPTQAAAARTLADTVRSMADAAASVQEDVRALQSDQATSLQKLSETISASLREVATEAGQVRKDLADSLGGLAPTVERELRAMAATAATAQKDQLGRLEEANTQAAAAILELTEQIDRVGTAQVEGLDETVRALRALATDVNEKLSKGVADNLRAISNSITAYEKLYKVQKMMGANLKAVATSNAFQEMIGKLSRSIKQLVPMLAQLEARLAETATQRERIPDGWFANLLRKRDGAR